MRRSSVSAVSSFAHLAVVAQRPASRQRFTWYSATWWREREEGGKETRQNENVRERGRTERERDR